MVLLYEYVLHNFMSLCVYECVCLSLSIYTHRVRENDHTGLDHVYLDQYTDSNIVQK